MGIANKKKQAYGFAIKGGFFRGSYSASRKEKL